MMLYAKATKIAFKPECPTIVTVTLLGIAGTVDVLWDLFYDLSRLYKLEARLRRAMCETCAELHKDYHLELHKQHYSGTAYTVSVKTTEEML